MIWLRRRAAWLFSPGNLYIPNRIADCGATGGLVCLQNTVRTQSQSGHTTFQVCRCTTMTNPYQPPQFDPRSPVAKADLADLPPLRQQIRVLRIIVTALAIGVIVFWRVHNLSQLRQAASTGRQARHNRLDHARIRAVLRPASHHPAWHLVSLCEANPCRRISGPCINQKSPVYSRSRAAFRRPRSLAARSLKAGRWPTSFGT